MFAGHVIPGDVHATTVTVTSVPGPSPGPLLAWALTLPVYVPGVVPAGGLIVTVQAWLSPLPDVVMKFSELGETETHALGILLLPVPLNCSVALKLPLFL